MNILSGINTKMTQSAELTALVSDRIYPMTFPEPTTANQNIYPAVVYQLVSEAVITSFDAQMIFTARVQIDAYGESMKSALQISDAVFNSIHGYRGTLGDCFVGYCFRDAIRTEHNAGDTYYRVSQDFVIGYKNG